MRSHSPPFKGRGRGGVCIVCIINNSFSFDFFSYSYYLRNDAIHICPYKIILESNYSNTLFMEKTAPPLIKIKFEVVRTAVKFYAKA